MREAPGKYWTSIELTIAQDRLFESICRELVGSADYEGEVRARFDHLVFLLVKFVSDRMDAEGARFSYLRTVPTGSDLPMEAELQEDLNSFLTSADFPAQERRNVAAGRTDIVLDYRRFRFVIEVKRETDNWSNSSMRAYINQSSAYQQTDVRLGVLAVLDLTDRPSGVPHLDQAISVVRRAVENEPERTVVLLRIPGNRRKPSGGT